MYARLGRYLFSLFVEFFVLQWSVRFRVKAFKFQILSLHDILGVSRGCHSRTIGRGFYGL